MSDVLKALAKELLPLLEGEQQTRFGVKHNASGTPIGVGYSHGPGGLLTFPGVDPDVFHTTVGIQGILGQLPTKASVYTNPTYYTITGVQDVTGSEKQQPCDNAPTAGLMKACLTTSVFGRYERATGELELNRLGQRNDRADPLDLRMVGTPIGQSGIFATGPGNPAAPGDTLVNEVGRKFWELGVAFHRLLSTQIWRGDPSNNAGGGGYKELTGFNQLINTGYVDAETNTSCPSVDSKLFNFNRSRVDANGTLLVSMLSSLLRTRRDLAFRTGMLPVRWVLAMRPEAFWAITEVWPCSYLTYRCQMTGNERLVIDGTEQVKMRDEMRQGKFLLIDGEKLEIVLDDGITEQSNLDVGAIPSGCFASDLFLVPMSVVGGQAVTFLEYFDYDNPSARQALQDPMILGRAEGAFLTWPRQTNQCVVWQSKIEPRLVVRTPWLAGRIQNVMYCPIDHAREPLPGDDYFVDGGRTSRTAQGPSYYALWK